MEERGSERLVSEIESNMAVKMLLLHRHMHSVNS